MKHYESQEEYDLEEAKKLKDKGLILPELIKGDPGKDGENYILTLRDKEEIAKKIKIPVIEKVIEKVIQKTEVIKPIITKEITNEIKQIAIHETPNEVRDKLESLQGKDRLNKSAIDGLDNIIYQDILDRAISILDQRTSYLINKVSNLASQGTGTGTGTSSAGGSNTQIQYNNAGAFGGTSYLVVGASGVESPTGAFAIKDTSSGFKVTFNTNNLFQNRNIYFQDGDGTVAFSADLNAFATTALNNLSAVAINTALLLGTSDGAALGSTTKMWSDLFLASGAVINFNAGDITLTHASTKLSLGGGTFNIPSNTSGLKLGASSTTHFYGDDSNGTNGVTFLTSTRASQEFKMSGTATIFRMLAYDVAGEGYFQVGLNGGSNAGKIFFSGISGSDATSVTFSATNSYVNGNLTIGATSGGSGKLNVIATTEQLRLSYDSSNRMTATISSTGGVTFDAVGSGAAFTFSDSVLFSAKMTNYNGVATTGWGIPAIYGTGRSTAQTAAVASVASYTCGAADGSFEISMNVLVTTSTLHNFNCECAYTDEGNTARVLTLQFSTIAGAFVTAITNAQGAVPYEGVPLHIRVKASTAITLRTQAAGTYNTVTFNCEGIIKQTS